MKDITEPKGMLKLSSASNKGDSEQLLAIQDENDKLFIFRAHASHGYASMPTLDKVKSLKELRERFEKSIKGPYSFKDPCVEVSGSGSLGQLAEELKIMNDKLSYGPDM